MAKTIAQVRTSDRVLNQIQQNFLNALQAILKNAILDGTQLSNVELVASQTNIINHGLNRKLIGWILVRVRSESTVWDSQDDNTEPSKTLLLNCSNDVTVDLYVY